MATKKAAAPRKTTKAAPAKTTKRAPVKKAPVKPVPHETVPASSSSASRNESSFRFKKSYAIIILAGVLFIALLYALRGMLVAATVNGKPISRITVVQELERQSGKQTLESMVTKELILQEAKKKNITVSDQQVDEEIKKIESNLKQQGQDLEQVLSLQGLTRESLRDQVRIQKTVELLLGDQIKVSDKDVEDYIASNSAQLPQNTNPEQLKTSIKQELRQQKLTEKFQTWLQQLRQSAKIDYLITY